MSDYVAHKSTIANTRAHKNKICILGEYFTSKRALYERLRKIMYDGTVSESDSQFLTACLNAANPRYGYPEEHPVRWQTQLQAIGRRPEFVFTRPDGSQENPSIKRLSTEKPVGGKAPASAARWSVDADVYAYRDTQRITGGYRCEDCQHIDFRVEAFHVHHEPPAFADIWRAFLVEHQLAERTVKIQEKHNSTGLMVSYGLAAPLDLAFREFHRQRARLKLLCLECHDRVTHNR